MRILFLIEIDLLNWQQQQQSQITVIRSGCAIAFEIIRKRQFQPTTFFQLRLDVDDEIELEWKSNAACVTRRREKNTTNMISHGYIVVCVFDYMQYWIDWKFPKSCCYESRAPSNQQASIIYYINVQRISIDSIWNTDHCLILKAIPHTLKHYVLFLLVFFFSPFVQRQRNKPIESVLCACTCYAYKITFNIMCLGTILFSFLLLWCSLAI